MWDIYCIETWWKEIDSEGYPKEYFRDGTFWSTIETPWKLGCFDFIEEFDDDGMCGFIGEFYKNDNYYQGKYYIGNFKFNEKKKYFIQDKLKEINISELENNYIFKYEGEFKKGKFYKGKEYIDNQLLFEGEYKQGKYWNGKMYKIKNKSINKMEGFEGIYENGYKKGEYYIKKKEMWL